MAGRVAVRRGRSRYGLATQRKVCNTRAGEKSPALRVYWRLDHALERSAFHHAAVQADGAGDGGRTDVIRVTTAHRVRPGSLRAFGAARTARAPTPAGGGADCDGDEKSAHTEELSASSRARFRHGDGFQQDSANRPPLLSRLRLRNFHDHDRVVRDSRLPFHV